MNIHDACVAVAESRSVAVLSKLPGCEYHRIILNQPLPARFGGQTSYGTWVFLCPRCLDAFGEDLGLGGGRLLLLLNVEEL